MSLLRAAQAVEQQIERCAGDIVGSVCVWVLDRILGPAEPFEYVSTTTPERVSNDST